MDLQFEFIYVITYAMAYHIAYVTTYVITWLFDRLVTNPTAAIIKSQGSKKFKQIHGNGNNDMLNITKPE